jgi:hypothetical protein
VPSVGAVDLPQSVAFVADPPRCQAPCGLSSHSAGADRRSTGSDPRFRRRAPRRQHRRTAGKKRSVSNLADARRTALSNWRIAMRRTRPIQLGWCQLAVLAGGILGVLAVTRAMGAGHWEELWVRQVAIPRIQAKYGFECGNVPVQRLGYSTLWAITKVTPGGRLSRLGVRDGDVPFEHNGMGWVAMYDALTDAERGQFAQFDVINAHALAVGRTDGDFRAIVANPPDTELARHFFGWFKGELPSPGGGQTIRVARTGDGSGELWIRDVATGRETKLFAFDLDVDVVWSPDGQWIAVSEHAASGGRCVLLDVSGEPPRNLSQLIESHDETTQKHMQDNKDVGCGVFGWVRGTSRVALTVSGAGRADPRGFRQDFFYDVASGTVLAAR